MDMDYTSTGVGNAGLATGIIGTALGVLNGAGGILNLRNGTTQDSNYVTKEAYNIQLELIDQQKQNAILQADLDSEKKMVSVFQAANDKINTVRDELRTEIRSVETKVDSNAASQGVINAQVGSQLAVNTSQIAQLYGMTKLVMPNGSVCPGWGAVTITPSNTGTTIS